MSENHEPARQPTRPVFAEPKAPADGEPGQDAWDDEESVLSWQLVAGAFVGLVVLLIAAFVVFGGGDDDGTADGGGGAGAAATLSDDFQRPDSPNDLGTASSGQAWEVVQGSWGIGAGQALVSEPNTEGGKRSLAVLDLGSPNGSFTVTATTITTGWGIVFRYRGAYNYWMLVASPEYGTYNLQKVIDGKVVPVTPGGIGLAKVQDGTKVGVELNGPSITVMIDGAPVKTIQDADLQAATKVGLVVGERGAASARWDDLVGRAGPVTAPPPAGGAPAAPAPSPTAAPAPGAPSPTAAPTAPAEGGGEGDADGG